MSKKLTVCLALAVALSSASLAGCIWDDAEQPDFSGYSMIAELATVECSYHNVATVKNDGTDCLFGINFDYKKAWFEYDGTVQLGIDVSKVSIEGPSRDNVVTITVPEAQVLGTPEVNEESISDIYSAKGLMAKITTVDQAQALAEAQSKMAESAGNNKTLMDNARDRAKTLLSQYVTSVGEKMGTNYKVEFKDAE